MSRSWEQPAVRELIALRGSFPAWPYRQGLALAVEPTVLALLALNASPENPAPGHPSGEAVTAPDVPALVEFNKAASEWLEKMQQPDGSTRLTERLIKPGWATAYALLFWNLVPYSDPLREHACRWLLNTKGHTFVPTPGTAQALGHDPTLVGWPWVAGTHSWVEPTALAILALDREGLGAHSRVQQGVTMILDRAIKSGGWNYGNTTAFGSQLRPQPGPTGVALLALANHDRSSKKIALAIDYLRQTLPTIHASVSLGWGILGLKAHGACPKESDAWLASAYDRSLRRPREAMSLAMMLLAASEHGVSLFRPPTPKTPAPDIARAKSLQLQSSSEHKS